MLNREYKAYKRARVGTEEKKANLLVEFEQWLSQKVATRTIQQHSQDIEPYINTFLLRKEAATTGQAARRIATFLGYWFIPWASSASPASSKEHAGSVKKFCSFMQEKGEIDASVLNDLKQKITEATNQ